MIGMKSSIEIITSFLKDESRQSIEILTIWGMAGIEKTYLANYVFQLHYLDFERSCFLEDIERRCTPPNRLLDLQKQLLKDIQARSWANITNVKVGTSKIEKSLLRERTLLVLDGITKYEQLNVLIGTKGLHPGSKVIITSKKELSTEKCKLFESQVPPKHMKHYLEGLNDDESLQLLSWHAFGCNEPNIEDDKNKAMKVVEYCQGHPLALKVLGSSLHNEDATRDDILESPGNEINPGIEKFLKISFDTFPYEKDKELFKYIACFFIREDRKSTEDILKDCGICRSSGIKNLINKCLLTVGVSDELMMHQLLRDMGRDIVYQESPKKPWKRSILCHHEECLDVLQNRQGTTLIQGLSLDMKAFENETWKEPSNANMQKFGSYWVHILLPLILRCLCGCVSGMRSSSTKGDFETLALSEMRNLRLLRLNYVQLSGSYKNFPQGLRWLCMHGFPLSYIPSDLPMENMVALDMSNSKLQQLWKKPKQLNSLKFLNLSNCNELVRVRHFTWLPQLERLILKGCTSLVEVCESIGTYCHKLEVLDLSECSKLKELPRSIGKLNNLTQFKTDRCPNLLTSTMVPTSSNLYVSSLPRSLVKLSLRNCNLYNESFPMDFSSLSMLKELYLDKNPVDTMPDCVRSLSRLEILTLNECDNLKTVMCTSLNCNSLEKITFHPEASAVPKLALLDKSPLTEIPYKFKIQALSEIDEEVVRSLGWINIQYLNHCRFWKANSLGYYGLREGRVLPVVPTQMLYEHGIFSTYLQGQEVPTWFTHRSSGSSFTLDSSPIKGKIQGINVCIVRTIASMKEVGPSLIQICNLTKNSSWAYQSLMCLVPEDDAFKHGDEVVVVWLSHWMFRKNDFEDGDEVKINFSVRYHYMTPGGCNFIAYGGEGPDYENVREYGISLVYDDGEQKEDPLGYYKSWKYIIGEDHSAAEIFLNNYHLIPNSYPTF